MMLLFCKRLRGLHAMEWDLPSPKWIFIINAFLFLLHVSVAKTLEPIEWDKLVLQRHPGGLMINASINDVIDIVCPTADSLPDQQYHKFTQVSKRAYEDCDLTLNPVKTLLHCNRPALINQYRLFFQTHTAYPQDPVFKHGMDYYFITTSDGTSGGINQARGGLCETHNMKLKIHVNGDAATDIPSPSTQSTPPVHRPNLPTTTPRRRITSPRTTVTRTVKPTRRKPTTKKMPNKSSENDSQTGDGGNRSSTLCPPSLLLILLLTVAFVRWLGW